ncbi:MAG: helix-turn-helix domain-containing protein [Firmicutes bacterium]|nr:helix-turn-helix domain-containing protein [Bacillota bacterium]
MILQQHELPSVGKNIMYFRKKNKLSINELSKRSGVSKSMLSQIEQENSNPTVVTVWKIARSLGVNVEKLLEVKKNVNIEVIRGNDIPVVQSEDNLCTTRINSPVHMTDNLELYQVTLKPGGKICSNPHYPDTEEFITVLSGSIIVTLEDTTKILSKGDTARYAADISHEIKNNGNKDAEVYLVVWFPK